MCIAGALLTLRRKGGPYCKMSQSLMSQKQIAIAEQPLTQWRPDLTGNETCHPYHAQEWVPIIAEQSLGRRFYSLGRTVQ